MKTISTTLVKAVFMMLSFSLIVVAAAANNGDKEKANNSNAAKNIAVVTSSYTIKLDNSRNSVRTVDSVLVVLDKYDLTGAGVVISVFYPDENNNIVLDELPVGKYYAEIYVYGIQDHHFSEVISVRNSGLKKKVSNKINLKLNQVDTYVPGTVIMPKESKKDFLYAKF